MVTGSRESVPTPSEENHSRRSAVAGSAPRRAAEHGGMSGVAMHDRSAGRQAQHADKRNRKETGRPSKKVSFLQPRNKEAGSEYQLKRQRADSKCSAYADEVKRLQQRECRCSDKCAGAWSDTPHGSHNMQCKVAYQRFLGLREKYLTDDHQSRPNSASFYRPSAIRVLEFMCGIAMLSAVWAAAGALICLLGLLVLFRLRTSACRAF